MRRPGTIRYRLTIKSSRAANLAGYILQYSVIINKIEYMMMYSDKGLAKRPPDIIHDLLCMEAYSTGSMISRGAVVYGLPEKPA